MAISQTHPPSRYTLGQDGPLKSPLSRMVSREFLAMILVEVKFSDAFPLANQLGERSEQFHAQSLRKPGNSCEGI